MSNPQLNLFSGRSYQDELFGSEYVTLRPTNNNLNNGPIDFEVKESKEYYDLSKCVLKLRLKIVNSDGTAVKTEVDKDDVALVNNSMHSVFSDAQVFLNGKPTEGLGDTMYPYKSYISNLFQYSREAQVQQLFAEGFLRDDCKHMDAITNSAFISRKAWTAAGASKTFFGRLKCALFQQDVLLIPGVDLMVRLERAKDSFAIFNTNDNLKPKVVIEDVVLYLLTVKVNPAIFERHARYLAEGNPVIYNVNKAAIVSIPIRSTDKEIEKEDLFYGKVPNYIVMAMVSNTAFHGDYAHNPFNFKHYNLKSLMLTRDGERIPYEVFQPNFKTGNVLREYMSLFQSNNLLGKNAILPITYDEFKTGYTNFQWNLTDDGKGMNSAPVQRGNLKLNLEFDDALPEAIVVILYAIFDSTILVFGSDQVIIDGV